MTRFSIIIPTYSNSDGVRACLESIFKHKPSLDLEVIVVANGAPEETRRIAEIYREFPVKLIWIPEPCGYTHATNVGIEAATGTHLILLNDDCVILGEHWISLLYEPFVHDERMGITGPLVLHCPDADRDFLVFFCAMVSGELIDAIGPLDEVFSPGYGEDCDYACRAVDAGWKIQQVPESAPQLVEKGCDDLPQWKRDKMWHNPFPIYHDGNQTFGKDPEKYDVVLRRNAKVLSERYRKQVNTVDPKLCKCGNPIVDGVCLGAEGQLNCDGLYLWRAAQIDGWFGADEGAQLAAWARELPASAKILEVGSWHGRSSRFIADNLPPGGQVWCVDTFNGSSGEPEMHGTAHWERGDHAFQWWWCNLQEYIESGRVVPVRMHSDNAAHTIAHLIEKGQMQKFDLIFIDGDHSEEGIKTDVEAWLPLLKDGGLICGHDYYREDEGPHWVFVRQYVEAKFPGVQKAATSIWWTRPHEQKRGKVFDCFLFHNELDVLEIRLATLADVVDHFVLVEGTITHAGQPKPLYFDENKERFTPWLHKIRHVVLEHWPEPTGDVYQDAWARERHQRDAAMIALHDCQPNDIVIIGDADEIASPQAVANYTVTDGVVRLKQRLFYYYLNCENKEGWDWQKIAPYSMVKERTPCGVRYPPAGNVPLVENGGWHFSFLGDAEHVKQKIRDYSHQEYNRPEILADVDAAVREGRDVFGRDLKYQFVDIGESHPEIVRSQWGTWRDKGLIATSCNVCRQPIYQSVTAAECGCPKTERTALGLSNRRWTVTACVSTKDRYTTTLPLCVAAIFNQTRLPDKFILYDDSDQRIDPNQLCRQQPFEGLFTIATDKGIKWEIQSTPRLGQVANHQHCLDNADTQFVWRVDDDEVPEPDCLEALLNTIRDYEQGGSFGKVGAVAGLVHHPGNVPPLPTDLSGALADIDRGNIQWHAWNSGPRHAEHLYSSFVYNVAHARAVGGYPKGLSPIGHREESWFSHKLHRAGFALLVTPHAKTWHLRDSQGGIRSYSDNSLWEHDEQMFREYLRACNLVLPETRLIVADFGLGDTLLLRGVLPELRRKAPGRKFTIAVCYPEVFENEPDVTLISIADAKLLVGDRYGDYSLYKWCWDRGWNRPIPEAMLEFWG